MRKKQAIELLKEDFEDYYNMSDRISDLLSLEGTITPIKRYPKTITFRKSAFVLSCCIGCAFIIGGSVGTAIYVTNIASNNNFSDVHSKSVSSAKTYCEINLKNYQFNLFDNYYILSDCVFNIYNAVSTEKTYLIYQIYTIEQLSSDIFIQFTHEDLSKEIVLKSDNNETIGILNDNEFDIQNGIINGIISLGNEKVKEVVIVL